MAKVLLIEDDNLLIKLYKSKFEDEGFQVISAIDGIQGLELAKKEQPDVILLDILMPKLNGLSVLENLKHDESLRSIPVIMLTNLNSEELISLLKGASEYLIKAKTDPSDVVNIVRQHLKSN